MLKKGRGTLGLEPLDPHRPATSLCRAGSHHKPNVYIGNASLLQPLGTSGLGVGS